MKINKLIIAASVATAAMFSSCSQEGPAGPTGPTGSLGMQSTVSTGTLMANVGSGAWVASASPNVYYQALTITSITDYVNDQVVAYVEETASPFDYYALPVTSFLNGGDAVSYSYNNSLITFYYVYTGGAPAVNLNVKVVVIPPAVIKQNPGLNLTDYKAVMKAVKPVQVNN